MQQYFKKYLPCFLLFLFLFPQLEKAIHDFEHSGDSHCFVKTQKHFHKKEHTCSICDFIPAISGEPPQQQTTCIVHTFVIHYLVASDDAIAEIADSYLRLRAPPVIFC